MIELNPDAGKSDARKAFWDLAFCCSSPKTYALAPADDPAALFSKKFIGTSGAKL